MHSIAYSHGLTGVYPTEKFSIPDDLIIPTKDGIFVAIQYNKSKNQLKSDGSVFPCISLKGRIGTSKHSAVHLLHIALDESSFPDNVSQAKELLHEYLYGVSVFFDELFSQKSSEANESPCRVFTSEGEIPYFGLIDPKSAFQINGVSDNLNFDPAKTPGFLRACLFFKEHVNNVCGINLFPNSAMLFLPSKDLWTFLSTFEKTDSFDMQINCYKKQPRCNKISYTSKDIDPDFIKLMLAKALDSIFIKLSGRFGLTNEDLSHLRKVFPDYTVVRSILRDIYLSTSPSRELFE